VFFQYCRSTTGHFGGRKEPSIEYGEWKASELNRIFATHGTSGQLGRISAATIRHGMGLCLKFSRG
jgi:hypothetical protein